ncbi:MULTISPECIES: lipid-A-disaccharide synthase [unclassified Undibacterium]|uniref:lipid-A-disaccharide synthase n=1 Tax=unclassified Undibacterium TaxID=2630295 RepID=UPI002AC94C52|nr:MULTISPECIES: lipid-A-disaccharide synthase [unclassified Undibacterium]MEB0138535.1 lipid-A-disaccharide synthase [Undibacterium sp. CCC2.1]MEB0171401.1 lipid-A-disaccharide synthase [Undibacterium sp. CCC1.1]MEB0175299.1 lipid-A-disaccharide synthase [Undibacterium sp. CCC3.4]MEB0214597.1 lipid-A-disaccharide synthase [Undibacterium sp. 5I2]WPX43030.1 lipid-A-disaccharide synthase [Undibacterium sp. CCC3.4]
MANHPPVIAMVAGETSGDMLANRLLSGLRPRLPDSLMHGIGGPHMAEYGFVSDHPMDKLSVRGLFEVLMHYREISGIRRQLQQALLQERPDVFIGVDAPDFNLDLEIALKQAGIPTMHYISPSIWAWRGGRIKKIAQAVTHMLVVFPFEEEIYRQAGIPATYVGHPLAQVIPMDIDVEAARAELGLDPRFKVVAILPGSRMSELKYNTVAFVGAAKLLLERDPHLQIVVPMAGNKQRHYYIELVVAAKLEGVAILLIDGRSHTAIAAADAVLVASGTASLEVALFKKPMVIAYKMMEASWQILKHMGYQPWIGLPNILAREFVVPEFLQAAATPLALADAIWAQLNDDMIQKQLQQRFTDMHHLLLRDTAALSAQAVLDVIAAR